MSEVTLGERRTPYVVNRGSGYSNPDYRWRWSCSMCVQTFEERDPKEVQRLVDSHHCGVSWCAVPMTAERSGLLGVGRDLLDPAPEDRERWQKLREAKRRRARA